MLSKDKFLSQKINLFLPQNIFFIPFLINKTGIILLIFKDKIYEIANIHNVNFNLYDLSGDLIKMSKPNFENNAIEMDLSSDILTKLNQSISKRFVEKIKRFGEDYRSSYMIFSDNNAKPLGVLNVPYFEDDSFNEDELREFLVRLGYAYFVMLLVAIAFAYFVSKYITRSLKTISDKMNETRLVKRNQKIELKGASEEVSALVESYNSMIDELEESAVQLATSEREQAWREMAKQVAHEIKNPLTPMRLNLQFLQNAIKNKQDNTLEITRKVTDSLIEQIDNLNYIASEFSNFAKLPDPQIAVFSLNTILESSVSIYKNESAITISLSLPPRPIIIKSDKSHLLRVFSNLLQNAVQSIPEGKDGLIQVNLYIQNQLAVVQVKDNGSGIPSSIREDVFIPHFTTKNAGSGIGLAMTKRIVEYWHGSIWFESIENEGTDFYVALPFLDDTIA